MMTVTVISFWLPLLWALISIVFWRFKMKPPVNHWLVCLLIGAVSFFYFAYTLIFFIVVMILKSGIFEKEEVKEEEKS